LGHNARVDDNTTPAPLATTICRGLLLGLLAGGLAWWWRQDLAAWGAMTACVLLATAALALLNVAQGRVSVAVSAAHLAMLLPWALLAMHWWPRNFDSGLYDLKPLHGALSASLLTQLVLLSLGVALTQTLLARSPMRNYIGLVCGLALAAGAVAGTGTPAAPRVLLALAAGASCGASVVGLLARQRAPARVAGALGTAAAVSMAGLAGASWLPSLPVSYAPAPPVAPTVIGVGDAAFAYLQAGNSGLVVLLHMIGWAGTLWFCATLAIVLGARVVRNRHAGSSAMTSCLWAAAAGLSLAAMLAPGGLFVPVCTLAAAVALGMAAGAGEDQAKSARGLVPTAGLLLALMVAGAARNPGLLSWATEFRQNELATLAVLGVNKPDAFLHVCAGLLTCVVLLWQLASRRAWLSLPAVTLALALGGVGEGVQRMLPWRSADWRDWYAHATGCGIAVVLYAACLLWRLIGSRGGREA
jgi:hypothetical protein